MDSTQNIEHTPIDGDVVPERVPAEAPVEGLSATIDALAQLDPAEAPDAADAIADRLGESLVSPAPTDEDGDVTP